jgi:hypothetical protein
MPDSGGRPPASTSRVYSGIRVRVDHDGPGRNRSVTTVNEGLPAFSREELEKMKLLVKAMEDLRPEQREDYEKQFSPELRALYDEYRKASEDTNARHRPDENMNHSIMAAGPSRSPERRRRPIVYDVPGSVEEPTRKRSRDSPPPPVDNRPAKRARNERYDKIQVVVPVSTTLVVEKNETTTITLAETGPSTSSGVKPRIVTNLDARKNPPGENRSFESDEDDESAQQGNRGLHRFSTRGRGGRRPVHSRLGRGETSRSDYARPGPRDGSRSPHSRHTSNNPHPFRPPAKDRLGANGRGGGRSRF